MTTQVAPGFRMFLMPCSSVFASSRFVKNDKGTVKHAAEAKGGVAEIITSLVG